jgi:multidrug transporter EmrE-like cation transporter
MKNRIHVFSVFILVTVIVIVESLAQCCLKKYDNGDHFMWFGLGALLYLGVVIILSKALRKEKMAIVNILWGALSAVLLTAFAYVLFNEKLNWVQMVGIVVTLLGIALIYHTD